MKNLRPVNEQVKFSHEQPRGYMNQHLELLCSISAWSSQCCSITVC
jgi:type IV secretory pathway protease TraF